MVRFFRSIALCVVVTVLAGCASDGSFVNPFESADSSSSSSSSSSPASSTSSTSGSGYYFSEFSDVPIPNDMDEKRAETFITFAPSGVKCGVQLFSGRLDLVTLMNSMRRNMANNGWTLRSLLRSKESVLVFEKSERVCSLQISDGLIFTEMRIFISPRLEGDTGSHDLSAFSPPSTPAAGAEGQQKLAQ